jgi:uncharacterized iron-regulated protein
MKMRSPFARLGLAVAAALAALLLALPSLAGAAKSNKQLVLAHIAALSKCDADALVDGYTNDATLFFPDGVVVQGRKALQKLYDGFVKSPEEEGLCGLKAQPVLAWTSGSTSFVKFKVTAPFLAKPYFSTDGYVFKGEKIAAEMSTFDASKLVFKK